VLIERIKHRVLFMNAKTTSLSIAVLPGDGIGPEVMHHTLRVLKAVTSQPLELKEGLIGGAAYERYGEHFPKATQDLCDSVDAILFGSVGGPIAESSLPKWNRCETNSILALRKRYQFAGNLRPIRVFPALIAISPLRPEIVASGVDLLIVRELLGDLYFGEHRTEFRDGGRWAFDGCEYSEAQIQAVAHQAFRAAQQRRKLLHSVDKANVLDTSKLWRTVVTEISAEYPDVKLEHMLVDNCAMQLIRNPAQFDVIVTSNMFGDILSDAAAVIPGSLGLTPSASINASGFGLYEPSGGSAPDIAGQDKANPVAQMLSAAMMLRLSGHDPEGARRIETAIANALERGFRTQDIYGATPSENLCSCSGFTDRVLEALGVQD
jgi:3-isopropylmalate dehydrogenase